MALTKDQKKQVIASLEEKIAKQKSIVFIDFAKVNSPDIFAFRKKLKEAGCDLKVSKKTLLGIAFGKENAALWEEAKKNIPGQLAVVFGMEDEVAPAKVSFQFIKQSENVKILGGVFENKFADREMIFALSSIPSRDELLAKLAGSIKAPVSNFVYALNYNLKGLIYLLTKIKS